MKYFTRGLVIGKFYPPHRGHRYLIDYASANCESVTVIVCAKEGQDIPGPLRARWINAIHPNVRVMLLDDTGLADDDSEGWAKRTLNVLGFVPDAVFTSEAYGDPYASFMGCVHVLVDKERTTVPISATRVRSDPMAYAEYLEPRVRAYFARRVAVVGAESTGTTTLSKALAEHYRTTWVPEYGRLYSEGRVYSDKKDEWRTEEFVEIVKQQNALEDSMAESSNGMIICDTDAFATGLWHERYLGTRSPKVEAVALERTHDLYILTGDEIPFEDDGIRDGEHIRHAMHARFIERLEEEKKPYVLVHGTREERLAQAIAAIDSHGDRVQ